jgi:hypothetical protein
MSTSLDSPGFIGSPWRQPAFERAHRRDGGCSCRARVSAKTHTLGPRPTVMPLCSITSISWLEPGTRMLIRIVPR